MGTPAELEPWPNRGPEVVRVALAMTILAALSTVWRLALRFRVSPWMGWSDWLMFAGTAMSFVCAVPFVMHAVDAGTGRLRADPFWTEERSLHFNHMAFICIALQLYAMFLVKLSICCYLLALNFSRTFRGIIWFITLVVVTFNLLMPLLLQFCYCRPYYHRWHADIVPECWPKRVMEVTEYAQTASNISIDLVYAAAPLVHLRQANLTKQMRFNIRIMFLLALFGTGSSIVKFVKLHKYVTSSEPFYDIAGLAIWGINEITICIVVANLPMQRKAICSAVSRIVPKHLQSRIGIENDTESSRDQPYTSTLETYRRDNSSALDADDRSEVALIELENGRIVMAPRTPTAPERVAESDRTSRGTLMTFWNNNSRDSI